MILLKLGNSRAIFISNKINNNKSNKKNDKNKSYYENIKY